MNSVTNAVYGILSNGYPESKDIITYILTAIGLFVTYYFSRAVLIATKKSVEAAEASNKLNQTMYEMNAKLQLDQLAEKERNVKAMRLQYKNIILNIAIKILSAIDSNDVQVTKQRLMNYKKEQLEHNIPYDELAICFSLDELEAIQYAWDAFNDYYDIFLRVLHYGENIEILELEEFRPKTNMRTLIEILTS